MPPEASPCHRLAANSFTGISLRCYDFGNAIVRGGSAQLNVQHDDAGQNELTMARRVTKHQSENNASFAFVGITPSERLIVKKRSVEYKLPKEVVAQLNRVTESFASARHVDIAKDARRWEIKMRALTAWQTRTAGIRNSISPRAPEAAGAPGLMFDDIVDQYFQPELSNIEERDPLALLARVLNGAIHTATFVQRNFKYPTPKSFEAELWFLWASIVFGVLREARVPLRYENAQRLLPQIVPLLERLQSHLPERMQRKKGAYSLRSAAVVAFRFSAVCRLRILREVFDHWTKGDVLFARVFTPTGGDADDILIFTAQFEKYFLRATGRARKMRGMGSRQK